MYFYQKIKTGYEAKGTNACKIALYRAFFKCGVKTWETVINALERSNHVNIADDLKARLGKNLMEINTEHYFIKNMHSIIVAVVVVEK